MSRKKTNKFEIMSSITLKEMEDLLDEKLNEKLDEKLKPVHDKLSTIAKDLGEIKRGLGYDNLKLIKNHQEKM